MKRKLLTDKDWDDAIEAARVTLFVAFTVLGVLLVCSLVVWE